MSCYEGRDSAVLTIGTAIQIRQVCEGTPGLGNKIYRDNDTAATFWTTWGRRARVMEEMKGSPELEQRAVTWIQSTEDMNRGESQKLE
jgi:hypothetical protein